MKLATKEQLEVFRKHAPTSEKHKRDIKELGVILYDAWLLGIIKYLDHRRKRVSKSKSIDILL